MAIFLISGASGSGKTSLAHALQSKGIWKACITHTTRNIRTGEEHGINYYYVTEKVFDKMVANDEFAENTVYKNKQYGVSKQEVQLRLDEGGHVFIIVEYKGYQKLKEVYPEAIGIFIYTSIEDCMSNMLNRGDSLDNANERITIYQNEINTRHDYDYVIKNVKNEFSATVDTIQKIVEQQYSNSVSINA